MIAASLFQDRSALLDDLLRQAGRQPGEVKRTLFLAVFCGRHEDEIKQRLKWIYQRIPHLEPLPLEVQIEQMAQIFDPVFAKVGTKFNCIIATPNEVIEKMHLYADAGVEEFVIQWADPTDIEGLRLIAAEVLPHLSLQKT
jgi:alkanesulfonate monooxygenase SsuD/methylene tetrahydromethanopterin reductase-like flavin-dependent oxidoreductase (luciferase family)